MRRVIESVSLDDWRPTFVLTGYAPISEWRKIANSKFVAGYSIPSRDDIIKIKRRIRHGVPMAIILEEFNITEKLYNKIIGTPDADYRCLADRDADGDRVERQRRATMAKRAAAVLDMAIKGDIDA